MHLEKSASFLDAAARRTHTLFRDWRIIGKAAVHRSVDVSFDCQLFGPAILRSGNFHGGTFNGGVFHEGVFKGGTFNGGNFHGGTFNGGTFNDGDFKGGDFKGGIFNGGAFYGGNFYGGTFNGGWYLEGTYRDGTFCRPVLLTGYGSWPINISGEDLIDVGCESHSYKHWKTHLEKIAKGHKVSWKDRELIRRGIQFLNDI